MPGSPVMKTICRTPPEASCQSRRSSSTDSPRPTNTPRAVRVGVAGDEAINSETGAMNR